MTAAAPAPTGLEFVKIETLHYGKLVVAQGGPVPMGEGYATTYCTSGILRSERVLPTRLLDGALLQPDHIEEPFRKKGSLFFRLVDKTLVAMRARYRSEAGEGRPGRTYLQASVFQVDALEGFGSVPPGFFPRVDEILTADPDLITKPAAERIGVAPLREEFEEPPRLSLTHLEELELKQRLRIAAIICAMHNMAAIVIGDDRFDDPNCRLEDFLHDVSFALRVMKQSGQRVSPNLQIACGLSPGVARCSLMLSSVAQSTPQRAIGWDDVVQMIAAPSRSWATRAGLQFLAEPPRTIASSYLSEPPTRLVSVQGNGRNHENIAPKSSSTAAKQEVPSDVERTGLLPPRPVSTGRAAGLTDILDEFSTLFIKGKQIDLSEGSTSLDLFRFAADVTTQSVLKRWHPFDIPAAASQPNIPQPDILLGLLMGIWGRGDLLECYTLPEFFCIWAHLDLMHENDSAGWVKRLIKHIDQRISEVGALTREEFGLVFIYGNRCLDSFSKRARNIIDCDDAYYRWGKLRSLREDLALGEERIVNDALKRMMNRYTHAGARGLKALQFSTSRIRMDARSIFHLPQREQVTQESNILLKNAVAAAEKRVQP